MRGLIALLLLWPGAALAHGGDTPGWQFDPLVLLPLLAFLALYLGGLLRLGGRARRLAAPAAAWLTGWLLLAGALLSPLHVLGELMFTAHMVEHELVMAVAAPLLVLGRPMAVALWAFPPAARRRIGRGARGLRRPWHFLTHPAIATFLHGAAIWAWHVPPVFDAVLGHPMLHRAQHLSFLLSALLFWWAMLRRARPLVAVADLFLTMLHTGLLGTLLVLAPRVLYGVQTAEAARFGLTPLEDQQLAGLVMWVPGGVIYAGAALALLGQALQRGGRRHALA
ncbi:cytochrome c oxidase assembly protein [Siccirubricoccus sp. KC 17139]|uniref:Cytochrome c oxidase assembly protein n=1 Tax=Siccirubricoccus soli TaxID=2899147 RepID=A0ABT1D213_9PROT|nr:cytochrome c oxidase assembly protein [Siccirubricoccus soli]MCO6415065.1 cytochrome c oxidase assembly protein [Siccirubricoccus soli]MCP2681196.1 cytochrome c oxidase assembly protein [Siccirubricoccus soli]